MKLIANNIHKKIKGKTILNDISLEMETGNIYGFWGRNGSGKTMLFRALSGLMKIDSGNIYLTAKANDQFEESGAPKLLSGSVRVDGYNRHLDILYDAKILVSR